MTKTKTCALIDKLKPDSMFLNQHIGKGETPDGVKFEMTAVIPSGAMVITFEDKEAEKQGKMSRIRYRLNLENFVKACDELRMEDIKKGK